MNATETHGRVLISGSSGMIGTALIPVLEQTGYQVVRLVRKPDIPGTVFWNPAAQEIDAAKCEGFDAVIHLAGRNLSTGRLTGKRRKEAVEGRLHGTSLLANTCAKLTHPPRVLVSAAAIGFYGERGDEIITEASTAGRGFLADLCRQWEAATESAAIAGIRVVRLRTAVVLSKSGGALKSMVPIFRWGLGGPLGNGRQWFSWIALDDHIGAILHTLKTKSLSGAVNSSSPEPVRQVDFARTLGKVLSRPAVFPVPEIALHLRFGRDLGEATLWSQRVMPEKLVRTGFGFRFPDLESALRHELRTK